VIDVAKDVRRWGERPPSIDDARADLQRAMGKLVFAHAAQLGRSGENPNQAPALAITDVFESVCAVSETVGWEPRELVEDLQVVIERWLAGEVTP
jgi:hypothetical protein